MSEEISRPATPRVIADAPVVWWQGLRQFYKNQWRKYLYICLGYAAVFFGIWAYSAAPYAFGNVVIRGTITHMHCGGKGYSYDYVYAVQSVAYKGTSGWGGSDGNPGICSKSRIGEPVWVTYSTAHPDQSLGGTIGGRFRSTWQLLGLCLIVVPLVAMPSTYLQERRDRKSGKIPPPPGPMSRQQRRALARREQKTEKS